MLSKAAAVRRRGSHRRASSCEQFQPPGGLVWNASQNPQRTSLKFLTLATVTQDGRRNSMVKGNRQRTNNGHQRPEWCGRVSMKEFVSVERDPENQFRDAGGLVSRCVSRRGFPRPLMSRDWGNSNQLPKGYFVPPMQKPCTVAAAARPRRTPPTPAQTPPREGQSHVTPCVGGWLHRASPRRRRASRASLPQSARRRPF